MECDERIRADLMGHKYTRPKYGAGGRLARVSEEAARIAHPAAAIACGDGGRHPRRVQVDRSRTAGPFDPLR